jgi:hypothetical protein
MNFNKFIFNVFNSASSYSKVQLFVFALDFCFELEYFNRPKHPKTRIVAGLEPGIALGAVTAPQSHDCSTPLWGRTPHLSLH